MSHDETVVGYTLNGSRYLNVTNHCALRCTFCPKYNKQWTVGEYNMRMKKKDEPSVEQLVEAAGDPNDYKEIVFCGYGDAIMRLPVIIDVAKQLREKGAQLRLNTAGLANLVYGRDVTKDLFPLIQSVSVSLNAQNEALYNQHCKPKNEGSYESMKAFVVGAREAGADVTVSAIDGLIGVDIQKCAQIAEELGVKFRRRVLDDVG